MRWQHGRAFELQQLIALRTAGARLYRGRDAAPCIFAERRLGLLPYLAPRSSLRRPASLACRAGGHVSATAFHGEVRARVASSHGSQAICMACAQNANGFAVSR